jgi:UDP-glucose 4-epimerase
MIVKGKWMSKYLITGGAGFIGSHLTDRLLSENNEIWVLDNLSLGEERNISHHFCNERFHFIKGDILDDILLEKVFEETPFDMVFHLAANSDISRSHDDPTIDLKMTYMTTFAILNKMRRHNVKQIMFASTSAIYGDTKGAEVTEDYGPLFPTSHYGACKLASEAIISSFCENYGIQAFITRFPNVCGERTTHGILHDFVKKLKKNPEKLEVLGNGKQAKPYLYVKDLVDAILFVIKNSKDQINFFNLGVEGNTSVSKIAKMVISSMNLTAKICYTGGDRGWIGDVPQFRYNLDKIHKLGWRASLSSDEAVQKAITYILENDLCNL